MGAVVWTYFIYIMQSGFTKSTRLLPHYLYIDERTMSYTQLLKQSAQEHRASSPKVKNHEGADAFAMTAEMELYSAVCTMALQPKFYETPRQQVERVADLIRMVDPTFVARLAVYTRCEMYLRSVPMFLIVELAKVHNGDDLLSRTIEKVIMRADEIMELLMCYQWRRSNACAAKDDDVCPRSRKKLGRLSHQIQAGLQKAFNKFDEYQFAKYDRTGLEVTLRDALFLVHPKAKDEAQQLIFDKIASRTLQTPYTWETELSALGQQDFATVEQRQMAFAEKWTELVKSGKMGYMALLRNLRNIAEAEVGDDTAQEVADRIADADEVSRAKQMPFRYFSAFKELKDTDTPHTPLLLNALKKAAEASAAHIKGFDESTSVLMACDLSGSMQTPLSRGSKVQYYEVGIMLAMLMKHRCAKAITGIFGDEWKVTGFPQRNILANASTIGKRIGEVGYGTEGTKVIEWLLDKNEVVDKVMFFTDCQLWDDRYNASFSSLWNVYKILAPNAHLYIFDLSGYGHSPIELKRNDVTLIAGWSDRIFDIIDALEHGESAVEYINAIEL